MVYPGSPHRSFNPYNDLNHWANQKFLFVPGISPTIKPLPFQTNSNGDIGVFIVSCLLMCSFKSTDKKRSLDRWEGIGLVCL